MGHRQPGTRIVEDQQGEKDPCAPWLELQPEAGRKCGNSSPCQAGTQGEIAPGGKYGCGRRRSHSHCRREPIHQLRVPGFKTNLDVLAEPRTVVITGSLGITESLHDGVAGKDLALDFTHTLVVTARVQASTLCRSLLGRVDNGRKVAKNVLGGDSLSCTTDYCQLEIVINVCTHLSPLTTIV